MDRLSNILKQRLHEGQSAQAEHPSTDRLLEFVERSLAAPQRENVLAHLAICPTCRDAVALATPEVSGSTKAAAVMHGRAFYLPTGMRWASLAAALAVAVGVGLISYEHQSLQKQSAAKPQDFHEIVANKYPTPANTSNGGPASPSESNTVRTAAKPLHQTRSFALTQRAEEKLGRKREVGKEQITAKAGSAGAMLGSLVAGQSAGALLGDKAESKVLQVPLRESAAPFANSTKAFMATSVPAPSPESAATNAVTNPVIHPSSNRDGVYAVSNSVPAPASEMVNVEAADALPQSNEVIGGPAKTLRSSAVSGPGFRARSTYRFNGIVHWAISQAGKLERHAQDGVATIIEPAAGVTFRALAAAGTGIEVWAGGLQPDLSAKEWRQQPVLFHSSDAGETWTKVNGPWHGTISQLRLADAGSVIVMAEDGTWKTTDAGRNWQKQ